MLPLHFYHENKGDRVMTTIFHLTYNVYIRCMYYIRGVHIVCKILIIQQLQNRHAKSKYFQLYGILLSKYIIFKNEYEIKIIHGLNYIIHRCKVPIHILKKTQSKLLRT